MIVGRIALNGGKKKSNSPYYMFAAQTIPQNAQKVKEYLLKHNLLHTDYLLVKEFDYLYFPLRKRAKVPLATIKNVRFHFPPKQKSLTVEEQLKDKLTIPELQLLPKSQETVGDILILEIPAELQKKEKIIAEAYLRSNKHLQTVVKKDHIHAGEYRLRKVKILAGKKSKETIHSENGIKLKLHLEKTYFSARSAHERLRIAQLIKPGEEVLVVFSGAAPYPLVIAKNAPVRRVYGIEINPFAHQYAVENVALNNLREKITLHYGDVREIMPSLTQKFDRVIMPLPKTGEEFLYLALPKTKPGGMVHLYAFLNETEIKSHATKIRKLCTTLKHPVKIIRAVKCGQFSPGVFRVCFDLKVQKG